MLKKIYQLKFKIAITVLFALVLLQLVTAYVFGFITETQMNKQFKRFSESPFIQIKNRKYHRGIFSSDSTADISLNNQALTAVLSILPGNNAESSNIKLVKNYSNYSIHYTTHIEHGIFAGILNGYFVPTLAYARTSITYPENMLNMLNKFFNNRPPLEVDNLIYIDKSGRFKIHSPKFDYSEAVSGVKVIWGGMDAIIKYDASFSKFKTELLLPGFELLAPTKGVAVMRNLIYSSNSSDSINQIKIGGVSLHIDLVKVEWKERLKIDFKIGDILHMLTGISSAEFLNGIDAIDPDNFLFSNISYKSNSSDKNNFFSADAVINVESLVTNNKTYGPINLDLSVAHIASIPFSHLMNKLSEVVVMDKNSQSLSEKAKNREILIKNLKQYFAPILVDKPLIKLNNFSMMTPDGAVKISGYASTNNFVLSDVNDQKQFIQKLVADIRLSVPKSILNYMFVLQMQYLLSAGNAQMDKQSSEALTKVVNILLDNQINIWVQKGYITNNNGVLGTHMYVESGTVYFNDKITDYIKAD